MRRDAERPMDLHHSRDFDLQFQLHLTERECTSWSFISMILYIVLWLLKGVKWTYNWSYNGNLCEFIVIYSYILTFRIKLHYSWEKKWCGIWETDFVDWNFFESWLISCVFPFTECSVPYWPLTFINMAFILLHCICMRKCL